MGAALNISQGVNDGDATVLQWGNTDRAVQQLYQEQKQREAQGYADYQASQQQLSKEFANVRSADTSEVLDNYQKWKTLRQQMLFDPKVKRDPRLYATAQQAANEAQAKLYQSISQSTEMKDLDKGLAKDRLEHPDEYDATAADLHSKAMQMPTSQRIKLGLNSAEPFLYKGTNTDFGAIDKNAAGAEKPIAQPEINTGDGIQYRTDVYKYGNSPAQYAAATLGTFGKAKAGQDAAKQWNAITQAQKDDTDTKYDALLKDPNYWKQIGVPPQPLEASNPDNKAEQLAIYKAKQYALNNKPALGEPKFRTDVKALNDYQYSNKLDFEKIRQGNREAMLAAKQQYKKSDAAGQNEFLDKYIASMETDAKKNSNTYKYANGQTETQYTIKASPDVKSIFKVPDGAGHYIYPDEIRFLPNGDVMPVFYETYSKTDAAVKNGKAKEGEVKESANGSKAVDTQLSQPVKRQDFKLQLGKKYLSKKELSADMSDDEYDDGSSFNAPKNILTGLNDYLNGGANA